LVDYDAQIGQKDVYNIEEADFDALKANLENALHVAMKLGVSTTLPFLQIWIYHYFKYAKTGTYFFDRVMKGFVCSKPYNFIHINYNGDLLACTHIGPYGNINDSDIRETWRLHAQKYKKMFDDNKYFPQCRSCFCDFGANYRYSLVYKPISNAWHIVHMMSYYISRYRTKTK
jgi:MoaA/NifB/PqqE/SkfB family radical SAM enzyme